MKLFTIIFLLLSFPVSIAFASNQNPDEKQKKKAQRIAQKTLITDGHIDLPYRLQIKNFKLQRKYLGIPIETNEGDFDYVRAKKGGLDAPFMSVYIPSDLGVSREAKDLADSLITMVTGIAAAHPSKFAIATTPEEVKANFKKGIVSLPMGMENGSPVGDDLANIKYWSDRGINYITLTHAKDNQICDSSYDTTGTWGGLSPFGRKVVKEMNRQGVMVDISHVSDEAYYQVIEITEVPVIASHSSCRKFTPGFERNMSDDMIRKLGENGGVIQINFGSTFIDQASRDSWDEIRDKMNKMLAEKGLTDDDEAAEPLIEQFQKENPILFADVKRVADHIDHVVALAGIDHVAFGSDFDGVGDSLPTGLKDVAQYPNLIAELLARGYSKKDIKKICYQNVFRVWQTVEDYANSFREK